jgi:septal ring factor EnvC (AmiA/AmiB activator)
MCYLFVFLCFSFWQELNMALTAQCLDLKREMQTIKTDSSILKELGDQVKSLTADLATKDHKIAKLENMIQSLKQGVRNMSSVFEDFEQA